MLYVILIVCLLFVVFQVLKKEKLLSYVHSATWILIAGELALSAVSEGRPPFKTFYETYILLAFSLSTAGLIAAYISEKILYIKASNILVFIVISWALLNPDLEKVLLPAALQSFWFVPHVMVYFLGYGFAMLSGALALWSMRTDTTYYMLIDHTMRASFLLLMVGICLGALWADDAWGTYWGWDPKESWALVSLLAVAAFCHLPKKVRHHKKGTLWVLMCTGLILFTYMGMHVLPTASSSMHVYALG